MCNLARPSSPRKASATRDRLKQLRAELARQGLTGFIVPHSDEYQSEYLPPSAERLAWLTGFTGSAGAAVVLPDEAAVFVDGRYTIQARGQVDGKSFTLGLLWLAVGSPQRRRRSWRGPR